MRNSFKILFFIAGLLLFSCSEKTPKGVIPKDRMEDVLYDFHVIQAVDLPHIDQEVDKESLMEAFYEKHHITKEDFDSSMSFYSRDLDGLLAMYEHVTKRIDESAANEGVVDLRDHSQDLRGDTLDIWPLSRIHLLTASKLNHQFTFEIDADTTFYQHDRFNLVFSPHFLNPSSEQYRNGEVLQNGVAVGLIVKYENDTISSTIRTIYSAQPTTITLRADSAYIIKSVLGFIGLPNKNSSPVILDGIKLLKIHVNNESSPSEKVLVTDESELAPRDTTTSGPQRRLSPQELRSTRPVERKVNIKKR